jgi:hypothetical protein
VRVYVEAGTRRVFACARDWPGWCRSGKGEAEALEALRSYRARYAVVAEAAGEELPTEPRFEVVERVEGSTTTDFGAPGTVPAGDAEPLSAAEAERLAGLVAAAWRVLDRVAADAPAELRKGPRGGGRDRDQVLEHVLGAEVAYARKLGVRGAPPKPGDRPAWLALREEILARLRAAAGQPPPASGWPARYAARRIAWHALDHAWEIEDRSDVAG